MVNYARYKGKGKLAAKGVGKGAGVFAVGYATAAGIVATSGKKLSLTDNPGLNLFNPLIGKPTSTASFIALVGSLAIAGAAETAKKEKWRTAGKIVSYAILGGLGFSFAQATIDPPPDAPASPYTFLPVPQQAAQTLKPYPYTTSTF